MAVLLMLAIPRPSVKDMTSAVITFITAGISTVKNGFSSWVVVNAVDEAPSFIIEGKVNSLTP